MMEINYLQQAIIGRRINVIILVFFFVNHSFAQLVSPKTVVCKNDVVTYTFNYSVVQNCTLFWSVSDGAFSDKGNVTSFNETVSGTGTKNVKIKWSGDLGGTLSITGCNVSEFINVSIDAFSLTVSSNASVINLGDQVTLTANSSSSIGEYLWSSTPSKSNLSATSGKVVTAAPTANTTFKCTASKTFRHGSVDNTCTQTASTAVEVILPELEGNVICCSQCIDPQSSPSTLGQSSSTSLPQDKGPFTFQWQRSLDGTTYNTISGATSSEYNPGTLNQTSWYRRKVNASGAAPSLSKEIVVEVIPNSPTFTSSTYSQNTTKKGHGTVTIQGDHTPTEANTQVNFRSDGQIIVLATSSLKPNVSLLIGLNCGIPNGRVANLLAEYGDTTTLKDELSDEVFYAYPNPSVGLTTIRYKVQEGERGNLLLLDEFGAIRLTLVRDIEMTNGEQEVQLNTKELSEGIYFYSLTTNRRRISKKLLVTK